MRYSKLMQLVIIGISIIFLNGCNRNKNEFYIKTDQNLTLKKVKVYSGNHLVNFTSAKEKGNIIFDGQKLKKLTTDYGENDFFIVYNNEFVSDFRHFKTNNEQIDKYHLNITQYQDSLFLEVEISGTDPMKQRIKFSEMTNL